MQAHQTGLLSHIGESAVAVVAQQRARQPPLLAIPPSAHHPNIQQTIIVVIGLLDVQGLGFAYQPRLARSLAKCAIAVIAKITQLAFKIPRRNHNVIKSVIIEIVDNHATCQIIQIQPKPAGDVNKARHRIF